MKSFAFSFIRNSFTGWSLCLAVLIAGCSRQSAEERRARAMVLMKRGDILEDASDRVGALELYLQAEKLDPDYVMLQSRIAKNAAELGKTDIALKAIANFERMRPDLKTNAEVQRLEAQLREKPGTVVAVGAPDVPPVQSASAATSPASSDLPLLQARILLLEEEVKKRRADPAAAVGDFIKAREVKIVDEAGRICLLLTSDAEGGQVLVGDHNQQARVKLEVLHGSGYLETKGSSGKTQVICKDDGHGSGQVLICDKEGKALLALQKGIEDGRGSVISLDFPDAGTGVRFPGRNR